MALQERGLAVSSDNSHLFYAGSASAGYGGDMYLYPLTETTSPPRSLLNVATRLRSQTGDNVLIGGFILTGSEPKKIILRATGPLTSPG